MAATRSLSAQPRTKRKRRGPRQIDRDRMVTQNPDGTAWSNWEYEEVSVAPSDPTQARPGSEEKVRMMAARYASGLPLWHREDCSEHSMDMPAGSSLKAEPQLALELAQTRSSRLSEDESRAKSFGDNN